MNQFYVSIIFLGIMLIIVSLTWIALDRKRSYDYSGKLEDQKNEMIGIIEDAEQMITELNKFSDYIVTQMDLKNEELNVSLKTIDEKIRQINGRIHELPESKGMKAEKVVNGSTVDVFVKPPLPFNNYSNDLVIDSISFENTAGHMEGHRAQAKTREKVVPINNKYNEVLQLSQKGMSDTEIAKTLSMGKGEIMLILEMNK